MKKIKIYLLLTLIVYLSQCSIFKKEDNKSKDLAPLFLLLQQKNCVIGNETFIIKEGDISCNENTIAGTGLLLASTEKNVPSLQATITLKENDSKFIFYGASDTDLRTNGSGFRFEVNSAKAFHSDGTAGGVVMTGFAPSLNTPKTVCLEIHTGETPPHLLGWNSNCPPAPNNSPNYNSENSGSEPGGTAAKKGEFWGLELKKAEIQLTINNDEIFSH
ncbi:MAG: hypothetical protein ACK4UJ_03280 [Leptonema sp. (in: bacteria)]